MSITEEIATNINKILCTVLDAPPVELFPVHGKGLDAHLDKHCKGMFGCSKKVPMGQPGETLLPTKFCLSHESRRDYGRYTGDAAILILNVRIRHA